jgi:hypothetical protein
VRINLREVSAPAAIVETASVIKAATIILRDIVVPAIVVQTGIVKAAPIVAALFVACVG